MQKLGNLLIVTGLLLSGYFVYGLVSQEMAQSQAREEAIETIEQARNVNTDTPGIAAAKDFKADYMESFGTLEIPKLGKTLGVVEGADADALKKGVGHMEQTVYPGQGEQIIFSGHRDTVFRNFGELEIGDEFIVTMPYGEYKYEIRETEIVSENDTTVVREMGEEVLVVTTCYPFNFIGYAPDRFVIYAYPVGI